MKREFPLREFLVLLAILAVGACVPALVFGASARPEAKQGWQAEWEKTLAAAKKEGKVSVFGPPGAKARQALADSFQKKFGIEVEYAGIFGREMGQKITSERTAGVYTVDVHLGGTTTIMTVFEKGGMLEPLEPMFILPEVKDPQHWIFGHLWTDDATKTVYLAALQLNASTAINTTMVKPEELKSFMDLLEPKWKKKITFFEPRSPGPGLATWSHLGRTLGEEYLKRLAAQDLTIFPHSREMAEAVVRGRFPIGIGVLGEDVQPFAQQGLPITLLKASHMKEGAYASPGPSAVVIFKNAPNPNAAKVYLNWYLSKEGQTIFAEGVGYPHRRTDAPPVSTMGREPIQPLVARGEPLPWCNGCTMKSIQDAQRYQELARQLLK
jgi:iron(III) transport system substrate-binding protein